jgi:hypothetical protein
MPGDGDVTVGGDVGVEDLEAGWGEAVLEDGGDFFGGGEAGGKGREGQRGGGMEP